MIFQRKMFGITDENFQYGKENVQPMPFLHKAGLHVPTKLVNQNTLSAIFKTSKYSLKNING